MIPKRERKREKTKEKKEEECFQCSPIFQIEQDITNNCQKIPKPV